MSSAEKFVPRYTVSDYQQWEGEWELWGGIPVSMTPSPYGKHSKLLVNTVAAFKAAIDGTRCDATTLAEIDWIISDDTVVRPDAVILCGREPDRHVETTPAVVVEILSDTTRDRDLTWKRDLYQQARVPCYLVIDPDQNSLTAHKLDDRNEFQVVPAEDTLELQICGNSLLTIRVASILD